MPVFPRNLQSMRHLAKRSHRPLTTISAGLEKGQQGAIGGSWYKDWPLREESYAAAQLLRQKQQSRQWSNSVSRLDSAMFRPVTKPDEFVPRRNNVVAAQNAAKRRNFKSHYNDTDAYRSEQQNWEAKQAMEQQQQDDDGQAKAKAEEDHDYESDLEIRSVRETVFGPPEDNAEEERERALADQELLKRVVVATKPYDDPNRASISRKVISPYNSYRSHRNRWAEFRHSMIFGRSSY
ncbi:uncharacterized protein LOC128256794 [Drosophila gunungcola]|uniref:Uncharacterized protein n=1 Tax=Drosophila gunungcola TaxID=103775 RepID=A0A9P9YFM4_9MUSC|nr:uncharacterized protein LOC128256794 [Drosophila gunungcola]KAI8035699.1 hypothetical protein M5D96_011449 [Drosophila gunungcola]